MSTDAKQQYSCNLAQDTQASTYRSASCVTVQSEILLEEKTVNRVNCNKHIFAIHTHKFNCDCIKHSIQQFCRRHRQIIVPFLCGILVGVTLTAALVEQHILFNSATSWNLDDNAKRPRFIHDVTEVANFDASEPSHGLSVRAIQEDIGKETAAKGEFALFGEDDVTALKTRLFVGVITAEKFLSSRALAVNNTWGSQADKVEFFTQSGSRQKYGIPVVNLKEASDTEYPPQRKAFEMLKYMCAHHIDDFEWFIRADDDVYIRVKLLKKYLARIDSNRMIYMGQPGHGVPEVRQKLGLNNHNFCMGGPGVIFNRKALKALCPHIDSCLGEVVSKEEDVEIGRCVTNHLHIECTHAWETLKLFYHSYQEEYTEEKPFLGNLAENEHVSNALTLHHLKLPYIMYRVHRHYTSLLLNSTVQELSVLHSALDHANSKLPSHQQHQFAVKKSIPRPYKPHRLVDVNMWKSFDVDSLYSLAPAYVTRDITNDMLADLKQIGETGIDETIGRPRAQTFTYSHVSGGYIRSEPHRGTDYLLDVYFSSKQPNTPDQIRRVHLIRPVAEPAVTGIRRTPVDKGLKTPFYVIVPVFLEKVSEFELFMRNHFESTYLLNGESGRVRLVVVPADSRQHLNLRPNWSDGPSAKEVVEWYQAKYPNAHLTILPLDENTTSTADSERAFSRGVVHVYRQIGAGDSAALTSSVVLLTHTNVSLTPKILESCSLMTGSSSQMNSLNYQYNFVDYKTRKRKLNDPFGQIFQPVSFRVYSDSNIGPWPTALVPMRKDLNPGAGAVPQMKLKSNDGFWDSSVATGEDENAVLAPLCARLSDIYVPARAALAGSVVNSVSFRNILYDLVYTGKLNIIRTPDRHFVNVPRR